MSGMLLRVISVVALFVTTLLISYDSAQAQQKKGDKEIMFFSGGFTVSVDETGFEHDDLTGRGAIGRTSDFRAFSIGGKVGYFITRNNEIGASTFLGLFHAKFCIRSFEDGQITGESCDSDTAFAMGLGGFYRYHFARESARGFFFVGADLTADDVTRNFTGNIRIRPHVGYKYFFNKNVALDANVGYSAELNKRDSPFFARDREGSITGQFALSFLF
jgi:hypothetical protein